MRSIWPAFKLGHLALLTLFAFLRLLALWMGNTPASPRNKITLRCPGWIELGSGGSQSIIFCLFSPFK
jgi:hypothetical protein